MYYLPSMEWLRDHNSLQEVIYSDHAPYFWCAQYMQERTRTGFDGLGAFIMGLFQRNAHEIFSSLGVVFGVILLFHVYYISSSILNMPKKIRMLLLVLLIAGCRLQELLVYQYVPQICGISFLILFIGLTINIMEEKNFPKGIMALLIAGTVSVYAEFCAYLLVIYFFVFIIGYIIHRDKSKNFFMLKEGALALLLNPMGVYRAIKINLFVLINVQENMDNIDPFMGKLPSGLNAFAQGLGLLQADSYEGYIKIIITILLCICTFIALCITISYITKVKDSKKMYLIALLIFFLLYELYFRIISYGYGEYKHLLSLNTFFILLLVYFGNQIENLWSSVKIVKIEFWGISLCIMISGLISIIKLYDKNMLYYYDADIEQLEEAARLVPYNETIGISGAPGSIHGMIYGLRNKGATILANNISYFPFSEEGASRYRLYEGIPVEKELEMNEELLWNNKRFYLIKNIGLQSCFYGGFHAEEYENEEIIRYTCDKESSIYVYNFSQETKSFALKFQTQKVGVEKRNITVMADGEIIAQGQAGDFIVSDQVFINANGKIRIYLYDDMPIREKDGRNVGFKINNYALLEFDEEH